MLWEGEEPVEPPVAFGGDTDKDALPEDVGIGVEVGAKLEAVAEGGCVGFFLSSQTLMRSRRRPWPAGEPLLPGEAIRPRADAATVNWVAVCGELILRTTSVVIGAEKW